MFEFLSTHETFWRWAQVLLLESEVALARVPVTVSQVLTALSQVHDRPLTVGLQSAALWGERGPLSRSTVILDRVYHMLDALSPHSAGAGPFFELLKTLVERCLGEAGPHLQDSEAAAREHVPSECVLRPERLLRDLVKRLLHHPVVEVNAQSEVGAVGLTAGFCVR